MFGLLEVSRVAAAPAPLECAVIGDAVELAALAPLWRELLRRSWADEPSLSPGWLLPWWQVYGRSGGRELRVAVFRAADRLVGLVPMQRRRYWYRPGLPFDRLEPLGADVDEGDGVCSEYLGFVAEKGYEHRVVCAWTRLLRAGRLGGWDEVVFPMMDGEGLAALLLEGEFRRSGWAAEVVRSDVAAYIPLPPTWEAYLQSLGKHRRYLVKTLRDFERWAAGTEVWRLARTPEELDEGTEVLRRLHAERWRADRRGGAFAAERFARFHDLVMPELLAEEALELRWLCAHGRPLAAVYSIHRGGKVHFYQSGRATDLPPHVRPGIVLHARSIREAIGQGLREYDFLGGLSRYKEQLSLAHRPLVQVRAVRRGPKEFCRSALQEGARWVRRLLRRQARGA